MKLFECQSCGNALHFDNTICLNCGHRVGYIQDRFEMSAVEPDGGGWRALSDPGNSYLFCANWEDDVCNWLIPHHGGSALCESCRHNRLVPDRSLTENLPRWRKIELAKRYLFRSLMRWRLPMPTRAEDPQRGLAFDLVGDIFRADGTIEPILTGHDEGVITINIAEADDAEREKRRSAMGEAYRTLVGHFRHEIGHYYWDRLVAEKNRLAEFREIFGDETGDYDAALKRHYAQGAPGDWQNAFISAYATSHPWEDFAETWAHYIHMVDALETARSYGININARFRDKRFDGDISFEPYAAASAAQLIRAWVPLTVAINGVNRSMGQPDLYPFVLSKSVVRKLEFVHELITSESRQSAGGPSATGSAEEVNSVEARDGESRQLSTASAS
jgi:hypothetical protein